MTQLQRAAFLLATSVFILSPQVNALSRDEVLQSAEKSKEANLLPEAESTYKQWLKTNPNDAEVQFYLAQVLSWQNHYGDAQDAYEKLLRENPRHHDAGIGLAHVLLWQGKLRESLAQLDRMTEYQSDDSEVRSEREKVLQA